jgi:hypothetical protein
MAQDGKKIWITMAGLPVSIELEWPFHRSTSGADFWVLHGDIRLEGAEGLHAPVAVNLSATVREVMASLEPKDVEAPVINALRKEVDKRQIEFVKSGKLVPVAFSSRYYDFKRQKWVFGKAADEDIATFIERKVYWGTRLRAHDAGNGLPSADSGAPRVWIADPTDAQYLETTSAHLLEVAGRVVAGDGLVRMEGEYAEATTGLMGRAERFDDAMKAAVQELEKKHAFERG